MKPHPPRISTFLNTKNPQGPPNINKICKTPKVMTMSSRVLITLRLRFLMIIHKMSLIQPILLLKEKKIIKTLSNTIQKQLFKKNN